MSGVREGECVCVDGCAGVLVCVCVCVCDGCKNGCVLVYECVCVCVLGGEGSERERETRRDLLLLPFAHINTHTH